MQIMPESALDAIDRRIIAELQAEARLSNVELADRVGLSPSPCLRRVKRLEREEYILGYRAALRRDRVGLGFSAFVGVKIDGHANGPALKFEEAITAMPEVIACHLVSGEADYLLEVVVPDLEHYQRFLVGKLLNIPIVREVRSNIAIYDDDDVKRLTFIRRCREFGFSIDQVRSLVALVQDPQSSCMHARDLAEEHLKAVRAKLIDLKEHERIIAAFVASCDASCAGGPSPGC